MNILEWATLSATQRDAALSRPRSLHSRAMQAGVQAIIARVRRAGDAALHAYTRRFDGVTLDTLAVGDGEFEAARRAIDPAVKAALTEAIGRIERWHAAGMTEEFSVLTAPGVRCGRIIRPIQRVGLYVPAGSAPLPSTVLMLGVPARLAGCPEVILCSPPRADGSIEPAILVAAEACGITRVFKCGGAQAIAAMAFGTASIPRCHKLFGPGNAFVSTAKQIVQALPGGPAIDMPAGPSEVLVIADAGTEPSFAAADLLAQAEHGPDSQVICLSDDRTVLAAIAAELRRQKRQLPRRAVAAKALRHARLIRVDSIAQAVALSNRYAPEHLILAVADAETLLPRINAAGSVFLGRWAAESLGDYCSGTNHTLPTNGAAHACSGVSVASFQKSISTQQVSREGLHAIGPCARTLARCEGLDAHAHAVSLRLQASS